MGDEEGNISDGYLLASEGVTNDASMVPASGGLGESLEQKRASNQ